ncbi:MAG: response regulator [Pseudomonadota bacterium]
MVQARILIADDDEVTLEMLEAVLQSQHQVTKANNGEQTLKLTQTQAFDLVLLDVDMPGLDGYATCQALKANPQTAEVPVIFLSAKVNIEERLRGYRVGAHDYLTKPFEVAELTAKIGLAIEQRERNQQLNGQIEEAMNTALSECGNYNQIAVAFFTALAQVGFDGCLRLSGRLGVMARTARAQCSALENSILDHIERVKGPSIQAVGDNTCFRYGSVLMLIQNLPQSPQSSVYSADDIDRFARARDNVALMAEGIVARMRSLDMETENTHLEQNKLGATDPRHPGRHLCTAACQPDAHGQSIPGDELRDRAVLCSLGPDRATRGFAV